MMQKCIAALLLLSVFNCNTNQKIDVQGHRGYRGLYPENTLIGFEKALALGVHTLELDVVVSKDHKVIVSHEPFMNHEIALDTNSNEISEADEMTFNLYTMTYDSIAMYDCGLKFHPRFPEQNKVAASKPLLTEVIALGEAMNPSVFYNIEIKSQPKYDKVYTPQLSDYVNLVIDIVQEYGIKERTTLQSFDIRALEIIHNQAPKIKTVLLVDENENIASKLEQLSFKPDIISPYFKLLSSKTISKFQNQGFKIIPWTVNNKSDISEMLKYNVDGIISDYPERVFEVLTAIQID